MGSSASESTRIRGRDLRAGSVPFLTGFARAASLTPAPAPRGAGYPCPDGFRNRRPPSETAATPPPIAAFAPEAIRSPGPRPESGGRPPGRPVKGGVLIREPGEANRHFPRSRAPCGSVRTLIGVVSDHRTWGNPIFGDVRRYLSQEVSGPAQRSGSTCTSRRPQSAVHPIPIGSAALADRLGNTGASGVEGPYRVSPVESSPSGGDNPQPTSGNSPRLGGAQRFHVVHGHGVPTGSRSGKLPPPRNIRPEQNTRRAEIYWEERK